MIPYSTQDVSEADVRAVARVLRSGWITQGPAIVAFEKAIAKEVGARFAVAFNSGTSALHAAYFAAGVGKGDEVIVPALTFAATANAALYLGAKPVFADVDSLTGNINSKDAAKKVTAKTKVLVAVDYAGRPAALRECRALARAHRLVFIEDGAQSLGARYAGKLVGTHADMTMFSFHPVKSITTGEGGIIVTDSEKFYRLLTLFRSHGITRDPHVIEKKDDEGAWHQEMHALGHNYRITDIQAALGESQLKRLGSFIAKRRAAARRYPALLKNIPGLTLPPHDDARTKSAWHLYPVHVPPRARKEVFEALRAAGIGAQVHYLPVYLHPFYRKLGYTKGLCPNAEKFYAGEISIPLFAKITPAQQRFVAGTLKRILASL
ncbi:UDP-4-amino-4,6-dideoxy-N-acetyl-beta-L-altrosamine transaminase [Candidatus Kaiserbacteria bacterium RIFCSPHIGHO2_02_FULL_54_22]|uniref:UDP-4-amino-4, 6-dideoxy-N-acetyl-beta-L-altrosamine transaminase n=1 Tax=Candidatus Kaiserbacteria bacterium RIFCSPHIGHO2_02_FULL_54_22 TaxID=1798495 RepID=A0A1F6DJ78_9BACT|nr:MAG: UDP-4-amino-4,6-dideoxy-N-acetyl-beta-L-altrosamine transaminase [Candidatus Kaiserbacteria bacterium RIFCSPHIGHO2_02_FULL_54_22]OGG68569.1 MAG: UDP-4-amino-4,6-dideoxy-N-acetyl-beta-L-altrosamine transaminase [Candidatus Kaiserbacteria bacterium RIFCSPHIGHO2_12_FULL_54_16]